MLLLGSVALVIVLMSVVFVMKTTSQYTIHSSAYQVYAGSKQTFSSGTKLVYKELGPTIKGAKQDEYLAAAPIYYDDSAVAVLPDDMVYVNPRTLQMSRMPAFSEVSLVQERVEYKKASINGFLFDGTNTYVFFEPVEVQLNQKTYTLSTLSMAMVANNRTVCLYNYATKEMIFEQNYADELYANGENFKVEMQSDVLYGSDNERTLLFEKPEKLDELN